MIKQQVNRRIELLNENGICNNDGKGSSQNTQQGNHSLVNFAFASIVSGHLCFNTTNNLSLSFKNANVDMRRQSNWIVDSGATDHICYSLKNFIHVEPVKNRYVQRPNNKRAHVSNIGIVKLNPKLILEKVLYVPKFKFNLISIR